MRVGERKTVRMRVGVSGFRYVFHPMFAPLKLFNYWNEIIVQNYTPQLFKNLNYLSEREIKKGHFNECVNLQFRRKDNVLSNYKDEYKSSLNAHCW